MFQDAPKAFPRLPRPGLQESNAEPVSNIRRTDGRSPSSRPPVRDIERLGGDLQPPSPRHERPSRPLEGSKRKPNNPHSFRSRCCLPAVVVVVSVLTLLHCHTCKVSALPEVAGEELGSGTGACWTHGSQAAGHGCLLAGLVALQDADPPCIATIQAQQSAGSNGPALDERTSNIIWKQGVYRKPTFSHFPSAANHPEVVLRDFDNPEAGGIAR
ncbi:hypothetical protein CSOJ01_11534 [Colletotrichum sojae]|uniref:Uncharacterized protein n=1 Tax=Colletotrichum sojae TaxID=2175907 RepID=A0A8H6IX68_9PEZI|nr:hypothetical protein CSOJ01_11534 [Colletotrichum sojae]